MKRLDPAHGGLARDRSGGGRRQMRALGRKHCIGLCKCRLDEQQIGIVSEPDDRS